MGLGKELAFHGAIYALTNLISRAVGFIMIPVYTKALTPAQYGIIELIDMAMAILALIAGQRISGALLRFYFDDEDEVRRRRIVSSGMISCLAVAVVAALILQPLCPLASRIIFGDAEYGRFLQLSLVSFVFNFMLQMAYTYVRILKKSLLFLGISLANLVMALSLNILLIVHLGMGVDGVLYSGIIASGATCLPLLVFIFSRTGFGWDWPAVKAMYVYTFPMIVGSLWTLAEDFLSRYFIRTFASLSQVGLFSLSYKFGVIPNFLVTAPFFNIWNVKCWELAKQAGGAERMARVFTLFNFVSLFAGLAISVPSREIVRVLADEKFLPSADLIPLLVVSNILVSHYYFFTFGMQWAKKTRYIGTISWITGAAAIALDFFLIRKFGLWGAASAFLAASTLRNALAFPAGQRLFPIPYQYGALAALFALGAATYAASRFVDFGGMIPNLAAHAGLLAAFILVTVLSGFFHPDEIASLQAWIRGRLGR